MEFRKILEGWRNHLIPPASLKEEIDRVSKERMEICQECPLNSTKARELSGYKSIRTDFHCTKCLCPLITKTKSLTSECPIGKWKAVASQKEEAEIKAKLAHYEERQQDSPQFKNSQGD